MARPKKKQRLEAPSSEAAVLLATPLPAPKSQTQSGGSSEPVKRLPLQNATSKKENPKKKRRASRETDSVKSTKKKGKASVAEQLDAGLSVDQITGRLVEQEACKCSVPDSDLPERPVDWWGASKFITGGCLGGLNDQKSSKARKSFTESTQEELYMTTHAAKSANKKGLGAGQGQSLVRQSVSGI